jgi:hypothetical protein
MSTATENRPVLDEKVWRAWLQNNELRRKATARKATIIGAIVAVLLALGSAIYLFAVR